MFDEYLNRIRSPLHIEPAQRPLGRIQAENDKHIKKYPIRAVIPYTVDNVNITMSLPWWHWTHDQGYEGSCVGHGVVMERAITNIRQNRLLGLIYPNRRYNPLYVWYNAKLVDPWPDTNPGDDEGTSVDAGYKVCKNLGLTRVRRMDIKDGTPVPVDERPVDISAGVSAYRWATTIDEMRTALSLHLPVTIGVNWYSGFDYPSKNSDDRWFLPDSSKTKLGSIRGGHCIALYAARDDLQAFKLKNSWGRDYPLAFLPYATMERLLNEDGEAAIITDR